MSCHAMPKGEMSTAAYCIQNILPEIVARREVERGERRLVVHAENARPYTANVTRACCDDNFLRMAPHSPYSPDLAPSDFFLFGHL
jgi:histone-lysine N-methyltransferase SETMAR